MTKKVYCIILTLDNYELLSKSIKSLIDCRYTNLKIFVFDNGSKQPIEKYLRRDFPKVEYLKSNKNLGFAEGNNRAVAHALKKDNPDYFLLFNNDAQAKQTLFKICLPYLNQGIDLLSPTIILSKGGGVDNVGIDYYHSGFSFARKKKGNKAGLVTGCCLFVSRKFVERSFNTVGWLFNPLYFSYIEDLELAVRSKLFGAKTLVLDDSLVVHKGLGTMGRNNQYQMYLTWRNMLWTVLTVWPSILVLKNLGYILIGNLVMMLVHFWDLNFSIFPKVYFSTVFHLRELLNTRILIQKAAVKKRALDGIFQEGMGDWKMLLGDRKLYWMGRSLFLRIEKVFTR